MFALAIFSALPLRQIADLLSILAPNCHRRLPSIKLIMNFKFRLDNLGVPLDYI